MVSEASRIRVVLFDPQIGFMVQETIEHIRGIANTDVDDLGAERCVLVGDVGIEQLSRLRAVLGIDVACALGLASGPESLAVRR